MSMTLEELRTALARSVSSLFSGTATGGSTTTLIDTSGLQRWTEDNALEGAYLYIFDTTDEGAPEAESRRITGYVASTKTITVAPAFSAAVGSGDVYEIYLSPLTLDQWDQCINAAIRGAWPELFASDTEDVAPTGALEYALPSTADRVLGAEVTFKGSLAGYPSQPLLQWYTVGDPGAITLVLSRPVPNDSTNMAIRVLVGEKYDELATGESTDLNTQYLLDAARARFYQLMADASRQAERQGFLQRMAHWQEKAAERKRALAISLLGLQPPVSKKE